VNHSAGKSTLYGHASKLYVREGQQVVRGQAIAAVGSTGMSTGPHLHFEVRINNKPVNPRPYLQQYLAGR
jgi:murein DD-endopeptidase MepM/ murein hydrolase activator NlpD